jgi:hypothetical protein
LHLPGVGWRSFRIQLRSEGISFYFFGFVYANKGGLRVSIDPLSCKLWMLLFIC